MRAQTNRRRHNASDLPESVLHENSGSDMHLTKSSDKQHGSRKVSSQKINDDASPSKHLWVGNVASSISETTLAEQFSRFGDIEYMKLYSARNYAFVSLHTIEDAMYAKKGLHGTSLGGLAIRIEFAKGDGKLNKDSQADEKSLLYVKSSSDNKSMVKGEELDHRESLQLKDLSADMTSDSGNKLKSDSGNKQISAKQREINNGEASEVLWIGFPLHLRVDEEKLHNHFSPFGGVEKITTFPGRTYAFVRFQNSDAASWAKDALQGKLFNDPRVSISFAKSEVGPVDHSEGISKAYSNKLPDVNERKIKHPSFSNANRNAGSNNFLSYSTRKGEDGIRGTPLSHGKEDIIPYATSVSRFGNATYSQNNKCVSVGSRMPGSPHLKSEIGTNFLQVFPRSKLYPNSDLDNRSVSGHELKLDMQVDQWRRSLQDNMQKRRHSDYHADDDELSFNHGYRNPKRTRIEYSEANQNIAVDEIGTIGTWKDDTRMTSLRDVKHVNLDEYHPVMKENSSQMYLDCQDMHNMSLSGRMRNIPSEMEDAMKSACLKDRHQGVRQDKELLGNMAFSGSNPSETVGLADGQGLQMTHVHPPPKDVFRWEGTIAKGGKVVCHCRCFPATKEIDVTFPNVLNYTARTSLGVLAKYVTHVRILGIVLFMPQGMTDVTPYQELMAFLADKKRAAVCNISEEVTLFLVPPSDFVEKCLKVPRRNNILGVVLGQQQQLLSQLSQDEADQVLFSKRIHASDDSNEYVVGSTRSSKEVESILPQSTSFQVFGSRDPSSCIPPSISSSAITGGEAGNVITPLSSGNIIMDESRVLLHNPGTDQKIMAYSPQGNHALGNSRMYQNRDHSPLSQDMHVTGNLDIPHFKTPSHQDASHTHLMQTFISNQQQSKQPVRCSPMAQQNLTLAQPPQQFSYVSQNSVSQNSFYDPNQGGRSPSADNVFAQTVAAASNPQLQNSRVPLFNGQPEHPTVWDKQTGIEVEQQGAVQMTQKTPTAENEGQGESGDGREKFKATLELAAALLKQLQKQTKI